MTAGKITQTDSSKPARKPVYAHKNNLYFRQTCPRILFCQFPLFKALLLLLETTHVVTIFLKQKLRSGFDGRREKGKDGKEEIS